MDIRKAPPGLGSITAGIRTDIRGLQLATFVGNCGSEWGYEYLSWTF